MTNSLTINDCRSVLHSAHHITREIGASAGSGSAALAGRKGGAGGVSFAGGGLCNLMDSGADDFDSKGEVLYA